VHRDHAADVHSPSERNTRSADMFAKLKKKIAEEAATAPRTGVRIPRTISRESIASGGGADSGDDFVSTQRTPQRNVNKGKSLLRRSFWGTAEEEE